MSVKRFDADINGNHYEDADGSYVQVEDYDALATRLRAAEALLLESDACIDILLGDGDNERGRELLAAIERHWNEYPEPLEETSDV